MLLEARTGREVARWAGRPGVEWWVAVADGTPAWARTAAERRDLQHFCDRIAAAERHLSVPREAREFTVALPRGLTPAGERRAIDALIAEFTCAGAVVVAAIHRDKIDEYGRPCPHAHLLVSTRVATDSGFAARKLGMERGPGGRTICAWDQPAALDRWHTAWARAVDRELERAGQGERAVTPRELQGLRRDLGLRPQHHHRHVPRLLGANADIVERNLEAIDLAWEAARRRRAAELAGLQGRHEVLRAALDAARREQVARAADAAVGAFIAVLTDARALRRAARDAVADARAAGQAGRLVRRRARELDREICGARVRVLDDAHADLAHARGLLGRAAAAATPAVRLQALRDAAPGLATLERYAVAHAHDALHVAAGADAGQLQAALARRRAALARGDGAGHPLPGEALADLARGVSLPGMPPPESAVLRWSAWTIGLCDAARREHLMLVRLERERHDREARRELARGGYALLVDMEAEEAAQRAEVAAASARLVRMSGGLGSRAAGLATLVVGWERGDELVAAWGACLAPARAAAAAREEHRYRGGRLQEAEAGARQAYDGRGRLHRLAHPYQPSPALVARRRDWEQAGVGVAAAWDTAERELTLIYARLQGLGLDRRQVAGRAAAILGQDAAAWLLAASTRIDLPSAFAEAALGAAAIGGREGLDALRAELHGPSRRPAAARLREREGPERS